MLKKLLTDCKKVGDELVHLHSERSGDFVKGTAEGVYEGAKGKLRASARLC
jgi:hypothetical protein